jgi:hypothetical protein
LEDDLLGEDDVEDFAEEADVGVAFVSDCVGVQGSALLAQKSLTTFEAGVDQEEHTLEEGLAGRSIWLVVDNVDEHGVEEIDDDE